MEEVPVDSNDQADDQNNLIDLQATFHLFSSLLQVSISTYMVDADSMFDADMIDVDYDDYFHANKLAIDNYDDDDDDDGHLPFDLLNMNGEMVVAQCDMNHCY